MRFIRTPDGEYLNAGRLDKLYKAEIGGAWLALADLSGREYVLGEFTEESSSESYLEELVKQWAEEDEKRMGD